MLIFQGVCEMYTSLAWLIDRTFVDFEQQESWQGLPDYVILKQFRELSKIVLLINIILKMNYR